MRRLTQTGFTDGAGRSVSHGDEVQYRYGQRHGIVGECMPDGDADIEFFDGKGPNMVKWKDLAGVPEEFKQGPKG